MSPVSSPHSRISLTCYSYSALPLLTSHIVTTKWVKTVPWKRRGARYLEGGSHIDMHGIGILIFIFVCLLGAFSRIWYRVEGLPK